MRKRIIRYAVQAFRFRRWSRKRYAAFVSRQRACTMGTLRRNVVDRLLRKNTGPVGPAVAGRAVVVSGGTDSPALAGPGISGISDRPDAPEARFRVEAGCFFPVVVCAVKAASVAFGATRSGEIRKVSGGPAPACRADNRFIYFIGYTGCVLSFIRAESLWLRNRGFSPFCVLAGHRRVPESGRRRPVAGPFPVAGFFSGGITDGYCRAVSDPPFVGSNPGRSLGCQLQRPAEKITSL